ncbi:hypothetical protein [Pseudoduganella albidiflava]|uniref:DUF4410 domain-containing protein n=1 Tax=Pseudoduganella albidiflava TaxID=321983 RepID=A0A411X6V3_9BURK|nr:hypothetical protein [Pseudoduganella albidiflava]QBI04573.1 hypothetical protein EYF70_29935 [Pseudoduganella albidiflava]GGY28387.1 hypothetical protein GCM10007387_08160 [Pseudoduganella albidiflava]
MSFLPFSCRSFLSASFVVASLLTLGGCASPVVHDALVPVSLQVAKHHPQTVAVTTSGGSETSAAGKSQVADAELQKAVADAITQSRTFSRVVEGKNGDYTLTVTIFNLSQPSFGFSFTVGVEMGWTLTRTSTGEKVWQESIKSEHTATASDAFAGVVRLRLATEGAVRNNIQQGITKLSALQL